jgi:hypothetical protein
MPVSKPGAEMEAVAEKPELAGLERVGECAALVAGEAEA